jgi:hypothetical protein
MSPGFSHWFLCTGALGFQVPQSAKAQGLHPPGPRTRGEPKGLGDPPEGAALVPEVQGVLQFLWIVRPPLGAANTPWIR